MLDRRLEGRDFVAGDYSIADIAIWPWISRFEWQEIDLAKFPNVKRWYTTIAQPSRGAARLQAAEGHRRNSDAVSRLFRRRNG